MVKKLCDKDERSANYTQERLTNIKSQLRISVIRNPLGVLGGVLVIGIILIAIIGPSISRFDPEEFNLARRALPPNSTNLFGTDLFGRDIFTRVLYGTRISLSCATVILLFSVMIGVVVGTIAGYFGGIVDEIVMRITDVFLAFPPLILAMVVNSALGSSIGAAVFAVLITWWPSYARMIRGQVLASKNLMYVKAAKSMGISDMVIILKHILPNCINPTIVQVTLDAGYVILTLAGLSFIGLGAKPPTPELGFMVNEGRQYLLTQWWWPTFPGLVICLFVVGSNLFGDFMKDVLDPRLKGCR